MSNELIVPGVRLSFPNPQDLPPINGKPASTYGAKLLLTKTEPDHQRALEWFRSEIARLANEAFGGDLSEVPVCVKDGDKHSRTEFRGYWIVGSNSREPVPCLDSQARPIVVAGGEQWDVERIKRTFYSGCYADAKVSLWAQKNQWGRRINCQLIALKFARDGEPFAAGVVPLSEAVRGFTPAANDQLGGFGPATAASGGRVSAADLGF